MIKGIGTDIVNHQRINEKIAKTFLSEKELQVLKNKKDKITYIASRFAAKEAIIKATNKKYLMRDIEISNLENGKPTCNIKGIHLTIAHEKEYSIAYAIWSDDDWIVLNN